MSDGKTSSRKQKIIRLREKREREGQQVDPVEKGSDSDWGFSEGKRGMAKETKIALSVITVLLAVFGYVVYQQLTKSKGLFSGSDDDGQMKVAKVPVTPTKTDGENEISPGTSAGRDPSNVFGIGDSGERTEIVQREPVLENWSAGGGGDGFFSGDSDSLGENSTINAEQPDSFPQANSEYPLTNQTEDPQFDSSTGNEEIRNSDAASGTQHQSPDFDREGSFSQLDQPQQFGGSGSYFDVKQDPQQGAGRSSDLEVEVEVAGDDFSNTFEAAGGSRDEAKNHFPQPSEPQQVRYSENQQFLTEIPDQQELYSEPKSFGFGDQPAGDSAVQPGQSDLNRFSQSPQGSVENNSQHNQADPNSGDAVGADVAAENRYRPEVESSIAWDDRFGQVQEPGLAGEVSTAKGTTLWREEPKKIGNRFDSSSRFSGSSTGTQPGEYEVQSGDNYWSISKKQYGTARYFLALSRYNRQRIPDEKRMKPGMKVLTPSPEILQVRYPDLFPKRSAQSSLSQVRSSATDKTAQPPGFFRGRNREPLYRVGEEDTLSGIAQRHLGRSSRWIQIYEMNRSRLPNPNNLRIGTVLQLPADASNVRLLRNPQRDR